MSAHDTEVTLNLAEVEGFIASRLAEHRWHRLHMCSCGWRPVDPALAIFPDPKPPAVIEQWEAHKAHVLTAALLAISSVTPAPGGTQ